MKEEDKPVLIKKITEVFTSMGLPAQAVTVIIKEFGKDNWASGGEQHSKKF
ncbi:MAG: tautomerase family protein [Nanoarchaeota archaeon]|nr:tautomerase family protein [Nanoarchaeota archaeon]